MAGRHSKYHYQPTIGMRVDFEKLLHGFSALGTVRYQSFAEIFREMKMSLYCAGRQTQREAREFVEECFEIAVQFWLPPSSFLVRVGALYLLYGLYFFQLVSPRVKIRVTPEQWRVVTEFHKEAKEQQHLDLEYIYQKLQVHKAFHFVATPQEIYPSFKDREDRLVIPDSLKEEKSAVEEIFSESSIKQLDLVHEQYQKMKIALNGEDATRPAPSLDVIHADLISGITKTLQTHRTRQKNTKYSKEMEQLHDTQEEMEQTEASVSTQKSLKKKAFSTSLGYYKARRKPGEHSSEDNTAESADSDFKSPDTVKPIKASGNRGRAPVMKLYEKDEIDKGPVQADLSDVFNMPDIESIIPAKFKKPEPSEEESDAPDKSPGKSPNKRRHRVLAKLASGRGHTKTRRVRKAGGLSKTVKSDGKKSFKTKKSKTKIPKTKLKSEPSSP